MSIKYLLIEPLNKKYSKYIKMKKNIQFLKLNTRKLNKKKSISKLLQIS